MNNALYNLADLSTEFYSMIRGDLLLLTLYHLVIYYLNKNKVYLYYSLYSFFLYLFLIGSIIGPSIYHIYDSFDNAFQLIAISYYVLFTREIIQTKLIIPKWDKILVYEKNALLLFAVLVFIAQNLFGEKLETQVSQVMVFIALVMALITAYKIYPEKKYHVKLFIIGSITFVLFLLITLSLKVQEIEIFKIYGVSLHRRFFLYSGAILEFVVFAFLISYRYKEMIAQKTKLDLEISKNEMENSELKMMTLKSQLNPHFLFNTLNSINNFILKNQVEEASDYITKFARFIRNILNNSNVITISLADELANLKIYILLEKIRTNNGFVCEIDIPKDINANFIKVPPLFLHPFFENAIWHGLSLKEGDKNIKLTIKKVNSKLCFEIVDNGIGLNKSKELNRLVLHKKQGIATDSALFRINKVFNNTDIVYKREDISNQDITGTRVFISFPIIN